MSLGWLQQDERGCRWTYRFMIWVALQIGRPVGRALLYPICAYYLTCSQRAHKGLRRYLQRVLGRDVGVGDLFRHYHCFAATLLDRIYLLAGQCERFSTDIHGAEIVLDRVNRGQGCILLGSHLGSFEIVRAAGLFRQDLAIKILMYEENSRTMSSVLRELNSAVADSVINVGTPDAMLQVKDYLDRGGLVGALGDRIVKNDKTVSCRFLGKDTIFPTGPLLLASVLKVPVILFFGLYRGGSRYEIFFELFAEQVSLDRELRAQALQQWMQRYAERLEHYCRSAPYNWFNFYDYWNEQN